MEPPPIRTNTPEVWPLIITELTDAAHTRPMKLLLAACVARDAFGRDKYGTPLQVENGRNPLRDALDAMAYTRQHYERVRAANVAAEHDVTLACRPLPPGEKSALRLHYQARAFALAVVAEMGRKA